LVQYCRLTAYPRTPWVKAGVVLDSFDGIYSELVEVYWIEERDIEIISSPWLEKTAEVPGFIDENINS
jgi:hypothetical protein